MLHVLYYNIIVYYTGKFFVYIYIGCCNNYRRIGTKLCIPYNSYHTLIKINDYSVYIRDNYYFLQSL